MKRKDLWIMCGPPASGKSTFANFYFTKDPYWSKKSWIIVSRDKNEILSAQKVILPGVGSFGQAMENLQCYDLVDTIKEVVKKEIPLLGI